MKVILIVFFIFLNFSAYCFPTLDKKWKVKSYIGETWYAEPDTIIGESQYFEKGWGEGIFFNCEFKGLSKTYNIYSLDEFFKNKEFKLFKKLKDKIEFKDTNIYVHRITCEGDGTKDRSLMYPFVTFENWNVGYYLFEGAIYTLEY